MKNLITKGILGISLVLSSTSFAVEKQGNQFRQALGTEPEKGKNRGMFGITYGQRMVKTNSGYFYNGKELNFGSSAMGNLGLFLQATKDKWVIHVNGEILANQKTWGWGVHLGAGYKILDTKYFTIAPVFVLGGGFSEIGLGSFPISGVQVISDIAFVGKGILVNTQSGFDYGSDISIDLRTSYFNMRPFLQAQAHFWKFTLHSEIGYNFALSNDAKLIWSGKGYTKEESDNGNPLKMLLLVAEGKDPKTQSVEAGTLKDYIKTGNSQPVSKNPISFNGLIFNIGLAYNF